MATPEQALYEQVMDAAVVEMLDQLAEMYSLRDVVRLETEERIKALDQKVVELVPEEIRQQIQHVRKEMDDLRFELAGKLESVDANIAAMEEAVRASTLAAGHTVKSARMNSTFVKGRITWDTKRLEGYAAAHPEIEMFKGAGPPTVRLTFK